MYVRRLVAKSRTDHREAKGNMAQHIVVAGEQIMVVEVEEANLYEHVPAASINEWLTAAGYDDEQYRAETAQAFLENGYDMPVSWADPKRSELNEIGVGGGYISGVIHVFQKNMLTRCGSAFARLMSGSVRTDEDIANSILDAKHAPDFPKVGRETGFAPKPEEMEDWINRVAGWVRPRDTKLADSIMMIHNDYSVEHESLLVPRGNVKSLALGTVMRGRMGLGGAEKLLSIDIADRGDGLEMIQILCQAVYSDLEESELAVWLEPQPIREEWLVESAMQQWLTVQAKLKKKGRTVVTDKTLRLKSILRLLGGCVLVKPILTHLEKEYGSALTADQVITRISVDSGKWLSDHNVNRTTTSPDDTAAVVAGAEAEAANEEIDEKLVRAVTAAVTAALGKGGKGKGRQSKGKGKGNYRGHCMMHQFSKSGCNKEGCLYKHYPDQLGRFAEVADHNGKLACVYYAKFGSCSYGDRCKYAHIEVPGCRETPGGRCLKTKVVYNNDNNDINRAKVDTNDNMAKGNDNINIDNIGNICIDNNIYSMVIKPRESGPVRRTNLPLEGLSTPLTSPSLPDNSPGVKGVGEGDAVRSEGNRDQSALASTSEGLITPLTPPKPSKSLGGADKCEKPRVRVITDSGCTRGIIGNNEIPFINNKKMAPRVRVQTASGLLESNMIGELITRDKGGNRRVMTGYIIPECPFSLWPVNDQVRDNHVYIQTEHSARIIDAETNDIIAGMDNENGLWVVDIDLDDDNT